MDYTVQLLQMLVRRTFIVIIIIIITGFRVLFPVLCVCFFPAMFLFYVFKVLFLCIRTVFVQYSRTPLTGLTGTVNHPDMQKIRIIGFFFENWLHGRFELEKKSTNACFRLHIYLRTNEH
jgi:hypothetical protein